MTVVALSGGVGGAKLALGLARIVPPEALTVIANVGDDFEHLGLAISPDIDTLTYVLAGLDDTARGWGRRGESWAFMAALAELGGESWFNLGDRDLALHVERTRRLRAGETLSQVTADIARRLGIGPRILPASDDPVRTVVDTADGPLAFQHYFVREQCRPAVRGFRYDGADRARAQPEALAALAAPDLQAVVICPSNPYISVDPILAIPALRRALADCAAPVVAVSPIVGGSGAQGAGGQDDGGTWPAADRRGSGAPLWRADRRVRAGRSRRRPGGRGPRAWDCRPDRAHGDAQPGRQNGACPGGAGFRGDAPIVCAAMWAIVPVKSFSGAKSRLAAVLAPAERSGLAAAMLDDVLAALAATPGLGGVLVVTGQPELAPAGVRVLVDRESRGQSAAVAQGIRALAAEGTRAMVTLPGDVPLATADEIAQVIAQIVPRGPGPAVSIAPARDRLGTNALAVAPSDLIGFSFGEASFEPHVAAARAAGAEPRILDLPGIGLDIDTPDDLRELIARGAGGATARFLESAGIARRLARALAS